VGAVGNNTQKLYVLSKILAPPCSHATEVSKYHSIMTLSVDCDASKCVYVYFGDPFLPKKKSKNRTRAPRTPKCLVAVVLAHPDFVLRPKNYQDWPVRIVGRKAGPPDPALSLDKTE